MGFNLHLQTDIHGAGINFFGWIVYGAPICAPMLFPDIDLLVLIGLFSPGRRLIFDEATVGA